jgi:hypothetical protein
MEDGGKTANVPGPTRTRPIVLPFRKAYNFE